MEQRMTGGHSSCPGREGKQGVCARCGGMHRQQLPLVDHPAMGLWLFVAAPGLPGPSAQHLQAPTLPHPPSASSAARTLLNLLLLPSPPPPPPSAHHPQVPPAAHRHLQPGGGPPEGAPAGPGGGGAVCRRARHLPGAGGGH